MQNYHEITHGGSHHLSLPCPTPAGSVNLSNIITHCSLWKPGLLSVLQMQQPLSGFQIFISILSTAALLLSRSWPWVILFLRGLPWIPNLAAPPAPPQTFRLPHMPWVLVFIIEFNTTRSYPVHCLFTRTLFLWDISFQKAVFDWPLFSPHLVSG